MDQMDFKVDIVEVKAIKSAKPKKSLRTERSESHKLSPKKHSKQTSLVKKSSTPLRGAIHSSVLVKKIDVSIRLKLIIF
jgi:hypothetical protein